MPAKATAAINVLRIMSMLLALHVQAFTLLTAAARTLPFYSTVCILAKHVAQQDRADENGADHHDRAVALDAGQSQTVLQRLHQDETEQRPDDRAASADDAGAAERHGGDDVELEARAHVGACRRHA